MLNFVVGFWASGASVPPLGTISEQQQEGGSIGFDTTSIWIYPVDLCDEMLQVVVDGLCLRNCIEGVGADHEGTYDFYQIDQFYTNVTEERIAGPYTHDHDCFGL